MFLPFIFSHGERFDNTPAHLTSAGLQHKAASIQPERTSKGPLLGFYCIFVFLYLWVCQAGVVGFEVVDDAFGCSGQCGTTHQQRKQHYIWKGGCQVHHLECTQYAGMWLGWHTDRE